MPRATPTMGQVIRDAIEYRLSRMHVCTPARVESYDAATQTAIVTPTTHTTWTDDNNVDWHESLPTIPDVPVAFPRFGPWYLHAPLVPGDFVLLHFTERSLDVWRQAGGVDVDPRDPRMFDLADAVAVPMSLYPDAQALTPHATNLVLGHKDGAEIHITPDGRICLGSATPGDSVATAQKVLGELQKLVPVLQGLQAAMHPLALALATIGTPGVSAGPAGALAATAGTALEAVATLITSALAVYPQNPASSKVEVLP